MNTAFTVDEYQIKTSLRQPTVVEPPGTSAFCLGHRGIPQHRGSNHQDLGMSLDGHASPWPSMYHPQVASGLTHSLVTEFARDKHLDRAVWGPLVRIRPCEIGGIVLHDINSRFRHSGNIRYFPSDPQVRMGS